MACAECGHSEMSKLGKNATARSDQVAAAWSSMHKPRTPHEAALKLAFFAVSTGAKFALSNVYECRKCNHRQRKWFD